MPIPSALRQVAETAWELPPTYKSGMRVPARIYATPELMETMDDGVFEQVTNVATLPGIRRYAMCMPDGHWGYGFPIGGVAAMDPAEGVISPGGIGFDINCGMRLIRTGLTEEEVRPKLKRLVDRLFVRVPSGVGAAGILKVGRDEFREMVVRGAEWCVARGLAEPDDLDVTEEHGRAPHADAAFVSDRAVDRGLNQIGTLGSGNHYLEVQVLRPGNIRDAERAAAFGLDMPNQVVVMLHSGSRGFGHQVATDHLHTFQAAMKKYRIEVPDRELASVPFDSDEGRGYFAAMQCAINMSYVNRQVMFHRVREVFEEVFGRAPADLGIRQVFDVAHNTAMLETHDLDGSPRELLVHRKGATRAFGPGDPRIPERYRAAGQPVIIGGSMETGSWLLAGMETGGQAFFSTAHGSGRTMSRTQAKKLFNGRKLRTDMEARGIYVRTASFAGLAEEAGRAYKDIDAVVEATERAGLSRRVARLVPIGNIKG